MEASERLERVRAAYAAAAANDFGPFVELLAPDVRWTLPGTSEFAGTTTSRDELFGRMLRQAERCPGGIALDCVDAIAVDRLVLVTERIRGERADGVTLDLGAAVVYRFEDDQVVEAVDVFDDQQTYDAFWARARGDA